jgi:hypothetical protein
MHDFTEFHKCLKRYLVNKLTVTCSPLPFRRIFNALQLNESLLRTRILSEADKFLNSCIHIITLKEHRHDFFH